MKRVLLIGLILVSTLTAGVSAQRIASQRPMPTPTPYWQGCVTVQNATEWEKTYVVVFDRLTVLGPGEATTICDKR